MLDEMLENPTKWGIQALDDDQVSKTRQVILWDRLVKKGIPMDTAQLYDVAGAMLRNKKHHLWKKLTK